MRLRSLATQKIQNVEKITNLIIYFHFVFLKDDDMVKNYENLMEHVSPPIIIKFAFYENLSLVQVCSEKEGKVEKSFYLKMNGFLKNRTNSRLF